VLSIDQHLAVTDEPLDGHHPPASALAEIHAPSSPDFLELPRGEEISTTEPEG
jgi:hypothetical protein